LAEAALPVGLAGFLIGVISMLAAESNPNQIAPSVAIAILTLVYTGIVRLLFLDSLNQNLLGARSVVSKAAGTGGVIIMLTWATTSVSPDGLVMFWYPQVAMVMTGVALLVFLIGRLLDEGYATDWAKKILGLGWLGFSMGIVAALSQLSTPTTLGPALAFSFLSLLYSTVAVILGLIWIPQAMTNENGSLSLGLSQILPIAVAVLATLVGLTVSLQ
jgi:flagellar motor component MotA